MKAKQKTITSSICCGGVLAILVVVAISALVSARVEEPDTPLGMPFKEVWDALLDLQQQIDDIQPHNGAAFPSPAYDSGWVTWDWTTWPFTHEHNIGGDPDNYVVEVRERTKLDPDYDNLTADGLYYNLTTNSISVFFWWGFEEYRVRIWGYE